MTTKNSRNRKAGRSKKRRPASSTSTKRIGYILVLLITAAVAYLISSSRHNGHTPSHIDGDLAHVATNPDLEEQLIEYTGMTVSFNRQTHQPNWVAWELLAYETDGDTARGSEFCTDSDVEGCATTGDYRKSGYDRGHMAPAGDMKWSQETMRESFLMTNICPQARELNRGAWKNLEEKCRQRAVADSAIVIVCGPIFTQGEGVERIGETGVAVPRRFFKVVLSPYTDPPSAIGFIMPNGYVQGGMQTHAVSVDSVESVTGHDFFSALPDDVEARVESQCNFNRWSRIRRK